MFLGNRFPDDKQAVIRMCQLRGQARRLVGQHRNVLLARLRKNTLEIEPHLFRVICLLIAHVVDANGFGYVRRDEQGIIKFLGIAQ